MTHYNRKNLLYRTLCSISRIYYGNYDYEVIIVDDASTQDDISDFSSFPNTKIIKITQEEKGTRLNPSVPYNIGFQNSKGDKIIIQNSENIHLFDILEYTEKNLTNNNYLSFACYKLTKSSTENLNLIDWVNDNFTVKVLDLINPINNISMGDDVTNGWYNHSIYRPHAYHFMNSITRKNLVENLKGFDERFAEGTSFDDDELVFRIKLLGLRIDFVDDLFCIHQYHDSVPLPYETWEKNRNLYFNVVTNEKSWKAKLTRL